MHPTKSRLHNVIYCHAKLYENLKDIIYLSMNSQCQTLKYCYVLVLCDVNNAFMLARFQM